MTALTIRLWNDDRGAVVAVELILIIALLVFGLIAGLVALRNSVIATFGTVGNTLGNLVPSFTYSGFAIGNATGGGTIAQVQGYLVSPTTSNLLTGSQITPNNLGTVAVIPPAP